MKGVLFAGDVREKIITRLSDNTYGFSAMLTTINTERTENTPFPYTYSFDPPADEGQYPAVYVDLGDSVCETIRGESVINLREILELQILCLIKHGDQVTVRQWGERYIEAILRSLNDYAYESTSGNDGNFFCLAKSTIRADLDSQQDMTTRGCGVIFDVHRNKGI